MDKSIGILGGMGPLATADLFKKIVQMTDASCDNDHVRVYIDNNAKIPDRTTAILNGGADPVPAMLESVKKLNNIGASVLIMPCNTAHYFIEKLRPHSAVPFISMLDETAKACAAAHGNAPVGLLATTGTINSGIYKNALAAQNVPCIEPNDAQKETLMKIIYDVKAGKSALDGAGFGAILKQMRQQGAEYFILGCTELPIVAQLLGSQEEFIDPTTVLAKTAIEFCGYRVK